VVFDPRNPRAPFFAEDAGRTPTAASATYWLSLAVAPMCPDVHPHRFRHDTARRLVEAVDLPTVAALLGHSRLDTLRIYAQPDETALKRAVAVLEKP
jgi:site-specific recombinase XerD